MNYSFLTEYSIMDVSVILLYIIGAVALSQKFKSISNRFANLFLLIGFLHMAMTVGYYYFTLIDVADSVGYYRRVLYEYDTWGSTLGQGTYFIYFTLYPIAKFLHISYFGSFFIYSFFGLLGFYLLFKILLNITNYKWTAWFYLLLLPLTHFWTVAIGKDSLIFFGISYIAYNFYFKKSWQAYIVPILLVGLIRIHILVFLVLALVFSQIFLNRSLRMGYKILIVFLCFVGLIIIYPFVLERLDFNQNQNIWEQFESLGERKLLGGSQINIKNSNLFIKWISYIFRPLFFDAKNVFMLLASAENLVWVLMFYKIVSGLRHKIIDSFRHIKWFSILSLLTITLPSAYLLSNLGVASRQKTMILPFVFILFFWQCIKEQLLKLM